MRPNFVAFGTTAYGDTFWAVDGLGIGIVGRIEVVREGIEQGWRMGEME